MGARIDEVPATNVSLLTAEFQFYLATRWIKPNDPLALENSEGSLGKSSLMTAHGK